MNLAFTISLVLGASAQDNINTQPSYTVIFKEKVAQAVQNHPQASAAIAARDSEKFRQREARAGLYPTLDMDFSGRYRMSESFEDRFDNIVERSRRKSSAYASLIGRQLLYDSGQTSSRIDSAKHAFSAAHGEYSLTASAIALLAVEVHFDVLFQTERNQLHDRIISDHNEMLEKVKLRFESGRGLSRDVALLEARVALAEADRSYAKKDYFTMISEYEKVYGFKAENLQIPMLSHVLPKSMNEALEIGFVNSQSISVASAQSLSAKSSVNAEKADLLPHLSVELAATKYDVDRFNPDYDVTGRLVLNYNLYSGGATTARISRSMRDYDRARHQEDEARRQLDRDIKVAFQDMNLQQERVDALEKATSASKRNSDQLLVQFEATGGSLLSLLEAKKDYYSALEQHLSAVSEQNILSYRLLDVMGTLLQTLNVRLDTDLR
ncbi:MAG: TolC family protein [Kordiimonadaceae bacterium]|nr:TolC family protein [Kordiimonadaceae bacterium]MBT6031000.1 TolC family protein [Kordiimonadaceae bacterium]